MGRLIHTNTRPRVIPTIVLRQERAHRCKLITTSSDRAERVIQLNNTRFLPWAFAVPHLDQCWSYQLRLTATTSSNRRARFVSPVPNTGAKLAGDDRSNNARAGLLEDCMSGFIQRARLCLVLTAAIASQERCQGGLNYAKRMPIPAWARRRTSGDSWNRLGHWLPGGPGAEFSKMRYRQRVAMLFSDGLQWL